MQFTRFALAGCNLAPRQIFAIRILVGNIAGNRKSFCLPRRAAQLAEGDRDFICRGLFLFIADNTSDQVRLRPASPRWLTVFDSPALRAFFAQAKTENSIVRAILLIFERGRACVAASIDTQVDAVTSPEVSFMVIIIMHGIIYNDMEQSMNCCRIRHEQFSAVWCPRLGVRIPQSRIPLRPQQARRWIKRST